MQRLLITTALLFITTLSAGASPAAPPPVSAPGPVAESLAANRFSAAERHRIRTYLQQHAARKPAATGPGLPSQQLLQTRQRRLQPGWQKKMVPGQPLDYRIYRLGEALPEDLLMQLAPSPGTGILRVEETIIRIDTTTRNIIDLFDLVNQGR